MSKAENVAKLVRLINVSIASLSRSRVRVANIEQIQTIAVERTFA